MISSFKSNRKRLSFLTQRLLGLFRSRINFIYTILIVLAPDGPPVEVVAIAISESRIFVSWEEPARDLQNGVILEYIVRYTNVEDASSNSAEQETVSKGNRVVISNLSPGATYRVRVAAKNSAGLSPWSPKLTVRTFKSSKW